MQFPPVCHEPLALHVATGDPAYPSLQRTVQVAPSAYDVLQSVVLTLVKFSVPQRTAKTAGVSGGPTTATHTWQRTEGPAALCISQAPLVFLPIWMLVPPCAPKKGTFC